VNELEFATAFFLSYHAAVYTIGALGTGFLMIRERPWRQHPQQLFPQRFWMSTLGVILAIPINMVIWPILGILTLMLFHPRTRTWVT